jgi:hypothetical protein
MRGRSVCHLPGHLLSHQHVEHVAALSALSALPEARLGGVAVVGRLRQDDERCPGYHRFRCGGDLQQVRGQREFRYADWPRHDGVQDPGCAVRCLSSGRYPARRLGQQFRH